MTVKRFKRIQIIVNLSDKFVSVKRTLYILTLWVARNVLSLFLCRMQCRRQTWLIDANFKYGSWEISDKAARS